MPFAHPLTVRAGDYDDLVDCRVVVIAAGLGFGRFLAAKIEFSYGAGQTVNLLALRLQWFESTPAHASSRATLQVSKPID